MALLENRYFVQDDITKRCATLAEAGEVLVRSTAGSGIGMAGQGGYVSRVLDPSGYKPAGMIVHDVETRDETDNPRNRNKDTMLVNEPCDLWLKGWLVTNRVTGTPTDGANAYLTTSGTVTPTVSATGGTAATPYVGTFDGIKDESGYIRVNLDM